MHLVMVKKFLQMTFVLVLSGSVYAQGWIKFASETDRFIVNFPGEPVFQEVDYISESDVTIPARVYSVEDLNSRYAITVVDYTAADVAHTEYCSQLALGTEISPNLCNGRGHLRDIRGSVAFEAWNIRRRGSGEITYDAFGQVDGIDGHQLQINHPDQSRSFIGIYMYESRLYVLEGMVPDSYPPPGLFQQSLGILDEEGRRVRFESDDEGNYTRVQTLYEYVGAEDSVTGEAQLPQSSSSERRPMVPGERTGLWVPTIPVN